MNLFNENTPITVRIRDMRLLAKINGILKNEPFRYANKNELLVELLTLGVNERYKTMPASAPHETAGMTKKAVSDSETVKLLTEIRTLLKDMHEYDKKHIEGLLAHLKMSERLSSAIYNLILSVATDKPVVPIQVELGYFDEVPQRFVEFLAELLKAIMEDIEEKDDKKIVN